MAVFVAVVVAVPPQPLAQLFLLLRGNLGIFISAQLGADGVGPGIVLDAQLDYDEMGGHPVWLPPIVEVVRGEPSELLSILLELGLHLRDGCHGCLMSIYTFVGSFFSQLLRQRNQLVGYQFCLQNKVC